MKNKTNYIIRVQTNIWYGFNGEVFKPLRNGSVEKCFKSKVEAIQAIDKYHNRSNFTMDKFSIFKNKDGFQTGFIHDFDYYPSINQVVDSYSVAHKNLVQNYEQLESTKPSNYTGLLSPKPYIVDILAIFIVFLFLGYLGYLTYAYVNIANKNRSLCEVAYKNKIEVSEVPSCFAYYEKRGF